MSTQTQEERAEKQQNDVRKLTLCHISVHCFAVYAIYDTTLILYFEWEEISLHFIILYCHIRLKKSLLNLRYGIT